ncbi:MAG: hypothetical protein HY266_05610 [Deltaproteobacteria bacterium]|nr:hypothetical protein [Deltaproteobacteria bacterium]
MTFLEYLKQKKRIDTNKAELMELMDQYYEEYREYLAQIKDGCGPKE